MVNGHLFFVPISRLPKHAATAKQSVLLTGLKLDEFDRCAKAILEVQAKLSSVLLSDSLQDWKLLTDQRKICLEFGNRYFSSNSDGSNQLDASLADTIDPLRILAHKVPKGQHTENNVVLYFD